MSPAEVVLRTGALGTLFQSIAAMTALISACVVLGDDHGSGYFERSNVSSDKVLLVFNFPVG